jgi:hypothetical protein
MADLKDRKDFLERDENSEIGETARLILESTLPRPWIKNTIGQDYGKDYHVEIAVPVTRNQLVKSKLRKRQTNKVTGVAFYVQLKGQKKGDYRLNDTVIAQELELPHLTHWADDVQLPLFLVVADTATNTAYYLFLQEYLRTNQSWRDQPTYTIHVPTKNLLSDAESLTKEIERAQKYMRLLRGGSVRETVDAKVKELQAKDPRFIVQPQITGTSEAYIFHAKEHVEGELSFCGDSNFVAAKMTDLIDRGLPVEFAPNELVFTGSSLFEEASAKGGVLKIVTSFPGTISEPVPKGVIFYNERHEPQAVPQ